MKQKAGYTVSDYFSYPMDIRTALRACQASEFTKNAHNQERASCSKSAVGLLPFSHQADIRMHSHCLPRLDENKPAASSSASLIQVISTTCSKSVNIKPDFHTFDATS